MSTAVTIDVSVEIAEVQRTNVLTVAVVSVKTVSAVGRHGKDCANQMRRTLHNAESNKERTQYPL